MTHAERMAEIKARIETNQWFNRAPWITYQAHPSCGGSLEEPYDDGERPVANKEHSSFIDDVIHAHNMDVADIPYLLARVEALEAALRDVMEWHRLTYGNCPSLEECGCVFCHAKAALEGEDNG